MPGNARNNKLSLAQNVSERKEATRATPQQQNPVVARERRTRIRRSGEAANRVEDAMDVAMGTETEAWDRRRRDRRNNAA